MFLENLLRMCVPVYRYFQMKFDLGSGWVAWCHQEASHYNPMLGNISTNTTIASVSDNKLYHS